MTANVEVNWDDEICADGADDDDSEVDAGCNWKNVFVIDIKL